MHTNTFIDAPRLLDRRNPARHAAKRRPRRPRLRGGAAYPHRGLLRGHPQRLHVALAVTADLADCAAGAADGDGVRGASGLPRIRDEGLPAHARELRGSWLRSPGGNKRPLYQVYADRALTRRLRAGGGLPGGLGLLP